MRYTNNGIGESNVMQNQFTSYLVTAIHRKKIHYLQAKYRFLKNEISLEDNESRMEFHSEPDLESNLPFLEQLESNELRKALERLRDREYRILTMKVLDERSFQEIADETGIGYKTVTSIYYRMIQKLRNELEE